MTYRARCEGRRRRTCKLNIVFILDGVQSKIGQTTGMGLTNPKRAKVVLYEEYAYLYPILAEYAILGDKMFDEEEILGEDCSL